MLRKCHQQPVKNSDTQKLVSIAGVRSALTASSKKHALLHAERHQKELVFRPCAQIQDAEGNLR
jgi:hypothetical protein